MKYFTPVKKRGGVTGIDGRSRTHYVTGWGQAFHAIRRLAQGLQLATPDHFEEEL